MRTHSLRPLPNYHNEPTAPPMAFDVARSARIPTPAGPRSHAARAKPKNQATWNAQCDDERESAGVNRRDQGVGGARDGGGSAKARGRFHCTLHSPCRSVHLCTSSCRRPPGLQSPSAAAYPAVDTTVPDSCRSSISPLLRLHLLLRDVAPAH